MSGLYGDIELEKSIGISFPLKIDFINSSTIIYSSGSALLTADTNEFSSKAYTELNGSKDVLEAVSSKIYNSHSYIANSSIFATAESNISALAANSREHVVAYSEMESLEILICQWPAKTKIGPKGFMMAEKDYFVGSLAFSFDGEYLVSLGSYPTFHIMVWDWRSNSLITSVSNGHEANLISFNPLNSKELCTSGDGEHIKFWKMKLALKKSTLECSVGSSFTLKGSLNKSLSENSLNKIHLDFDDEKLTPVFHTWLPNGRVLASSNQGNLVVSFDPSTGKSNLWLGDKSRMVEKDQDPNILVEEQGEAQEELIHESVFMNSSFQKMVPLKKEILFAGADGILRFFSYDGKIKKVIKAFSGTAIKNVLVSPNYRTLMVETVNRQLHLFSLTENISHQIFSSETDNLRFMRYLKVSDTMVCASESIISLWDPKKLVSFSEIQR